MNNEETLDAAAPAGIEFRISNQPVVGENRAASVGNEHSAARGPSADLLYIVARDPRSLFLYWDLNWTWLFARAGISARQVHLRTYRGGGSVVATQEINPFRGHCYAEVDAAGMEYYCELGSFDGAEWKSLIRSGTTTTPESSISDDFTADIAALPMHLSFQRLLDVLGVTHLGGTTLAHSVAELQENARQIQSKMPPGEATQLGREIAAELSRARGLETNGADAADLSALVEMALRNAPPADATAENLAYWRELGERYGGSSWGGGASKGGFGGSSPA